MRAKMQDILCLIRIKPNYFLVYLIDFTLWSLILLVILLFIHSVQMDRSFPCGKSAPSLVYSVYSEPGRALLDEDSDTELGILPRLLLM